MDDLDWSNANVGDLVFLAKEGTSSAFERAVSDVASSPYHHVGIVTHGKQVVHALPRGVVSQTLDELIADCEPHRIEIVHIDASEEVKYIAASFAESKVGMPYNDIFAPDGVNSAGKESYYCSQLITDAYKGLIEFPEHKLNFQDKHGDYLEYWLKYYEDKGLDIPQGKQGSHPASLRRSQLLEMRLSRHLQKQVLNCKDVTKALHYIGGAAVHLTGGKKFEVVEPRSGQFSEQLLKQICFDNE